MWIGSSYEDLRAFPSAARTDAGYQLHRVQNDLPPESWKAFLDIGAEVCELRLRNMAGIFRVMSVAKFDEAIYVLHGFQKKAQRTSNIDKDIACRRYDAVWHSHRSLK